MLLFFAWNYVKVRPFMPRSKQLKPAFILDSWLFVNRFACPCTAFWNYLFKRGSESIKVCNIVTIDGPCFGFLLGRGNLAIGNNANAFAIRKKLLFDTRQFFPGN